MVNPNERPQAYGQGKGYGLKDGRIYKRNQSFTSRFLKSGL